GELKAPRAFLLLVCAIVTLIMALYAAEAVSKADGIAFDSHWGGLGGGLGGFRISAAAAFSGLLLALVIAMAGVAMYDPSGPTAAGSEAPARLGTAHMVLVQMTIGLYRALSREISTGYAAKAKAFGTQGGVNGEELAAQLSLDLDSGPNPAVLRSYWARIR